MQVNKTLLFFSVWLAYENSQGAMLRNVANDIVYWSLWHHERLKKGTKYFLRFSFDDHSHVYHGYLFIKSNQCNIYVRRTYEYISLISTFRSTTRKSRITVVNCRNKLIKHFVTVYTHNNNLQVLRPEFTAWSGWKVPFCNGPNDQWRWRWWWWYTLIKWRLLLLLLLSLLLCRLSGGDENYNILMTLYLRVNDNDDNNTFGTYCNFALKPYFPVWFVFYWHYSTLFLFCDTSKRYSGYWMARSRRNMMWHDMTWHDTDAT